MSGYASALILALVSQNVLATSIVYLEDLELGPKQTLTQQVELQAGFYWRIAVEKRGIDVALNVRPSSVPDYDRFEAPTPRFGIVSAIVYPPVTGPYTFMVEPEEPGLPPGRVLVTIESISAEEANRLAAERSRSEGAQIYAQNDPAQLDAAIDAYSNAARSFNEAGLQREAGDSTYAVAMLLNKSGKPKEALKGFAAALPTYVALHERARVAAVWNAQGLIHARLGDYELAKGLYEHAINERTVLRQPYAAAISLNNRCVAQHRAEEILAAIECYENALSDFRAMGARRSEANALNNLGGAYFMLGEPFQARETFEQALRLWRVLGSRRGEANTKHNLANLYAEQGEVQTAIDLYRFVLSYAEEAGNLHAQGTTLNNMGYTYFGLGDYSRSIDYFNQSLELRRRIGYRQGEAATLNNLGNVSQAVGRLQEALDYHRVAADIAKDIGRKNTQLKALIAQARIMLALEEPAIALSYVSKANALLGQMDAHQERAEIPHVMGVSQWRIGNHEAAITYLSEALEMRKKKNDLTGQVETLRRLAEVLADVGNTDKALAKADAAIEIVESIRARLVSPELRAAYLSAQRGAYELKIDLLMHKHAAMPHEGHNIDALNVSEQARARMLVEMTAQSGAEIRAHVQPDLIHRESEILQLLVAKSQRRKQMSRSSGDSAELREMRDSARRLLDELEDVQSRIRRANPEYEPLTAGGMTALLNEDAMLVQYSLGEKRSYVWLVDGDSVASFDLADRETLELAAREFYDALRINNPRSAAERDRLSRRLGELLLGPFVSRLDRQRLVIAADGALHYVPFGALFPPGSDQLLITQHEIVNLPSATAVATNRAHSIRPRPRRTLAVLADPVFSSDDVRLTTYSPPALAFSQEQTQSVYPLATLRSDSSDLARLASSSLEAQRIVELVPRGESLKVVGFDANRDFVLSGELADYRIIHFATHGLVDSNTPQLSRLALSNYNPNGERIAGFLSLGDIYSLELNAEVVVLSACETALGREIRGEGLVGLASGFLYAGVPTVIASLWRVEDNATAELMYRLYRSILAEGRRPSAALRQAQMELMNEHGWRDPYYWAPFVVLGDWQTASHEPLNAVSNE